MSLWQVILQIAINVVSNIATPSILKALKHLYLTLTTKLIKVGQAFNQAISRTHSLAASKLNIDYFAEKGVQAFTFLAIGVLRVGLVCFWLVLINYQLNIILGHINDIKLNSLATSQVETCYCPTPTNSISTRSTLQPRYLPRNCPQPYGIRRQYPAESVLFTTESPLAFDCSPARRGRKSKRLMQPCSAEISVRSTSGYVFSD